MVQSDALGCQIGDQVGVIMAHSDPPSLSDRMKVRVKVRMKVWVRATPPWSDCATWGSAILDYISLHHITVLQSQNQNLSLCQIGLSYQYRKSPDRPSE